MGLSYRQAMPADRSSEMQRSAAPVPVMVLAISVLAMAMINGNATQYETIAGGLGQPRLLPFDQSESQLAGWSSAALADYEQSRQFFGQTSEWHRLLYQSNPGASLTSSVPVYVDVIDTDDPDALAAYGIAECYQFHGYVVESENEVALGSGVIGHSIDYHNPKLNTDWSALWWEWPYRTAAGDARFERVVVIIENGPLATFTGGVDAPPPTSVRFEDTGRFLLALGRDLVARQVGEADPI
jgi:hypothetical protein